MPVGTGTGSTSVSSRETPIEAAVLGSMDTAGYQDGAIVQTTAPRASWKLVRDDSTVAVDGLVIANGSDRWFRQEGTDAGYQAITAWYVSNAGDWRAAGTTEVDAITIPEVERRLNHLVTTTTTVHVIDDITDDITVRFEAPPTANAWIEFTAAGYRTSVTTGTVLAYTAPSPGVTRGELEASFALTSYVGKHIRVTAGAREGAQFFVTKLTSAGKAEVSVPQQTPYYGDAVALQAGDAIAVEDLVVLGGKVEVTGSATCYFSDLHIGTTGAHTITLGSYATLLNTCIVAALDIGGGRLITNQLLNCYVTNALRTYSGAATAVFLGAVKAGATLRALERGQLDLARVLSYAPLYVHAGAITRVFAWSAFFDTTHTVRVESTGLLDMTVEDGGDGGVLWGEGITPGGGGARLRVRALGRVVYYSGDPPVLNGSGTVLLIGGDAKALADVPYTSASGAAVVLD